MTHAAPTFIGYHGTSSVHVPAIRRGIRPPTGYNFNGAAQLGDGFYVALAYDVAQQFGHVAAYWTGGQPVVLAVALRSFDALRGHEVPQDLWWHVPASYLLDDDYLTAHIDGLGAARQLKVNPRAYHAVVIT